MVYQMESVLEPTLQDLPAALTPTTAKSLEITDVLYNKIIINASLLTTIHNLKTKGFNNFDTPLLILTILGTYNSYTERTERAERAERTKALTVDDIQTLLERVYVYVVEKYNLIDEGQRLAMYTLFDSSLKLCMITPNVKKEASCLRFFRC